MPAPRSLNTNLLFLAGELTHILHQQITAGFREHRIPVTVEQFAVLTVLFYKNGINQQEISESLNRNKTTMTRVIANMERSKLIVRKADATDARGKLLHLTAKGKLIQQQAIKVSGNLYMKAIGGLRKNELNTSANVLVKAIQNLRQ
jgi:DNA-binding MarR family transcriptional regulator